MIKIAHRGNFAGRNADRENTSSYIKEAITAGYNVEIDVWLMDNQWYLGHDAPSEMIDLSFIEQPAVWAHAKNLEGYISLYNNPNAHTFWHNKDDYVFTSKGIKWCKTHVLTYDGVMVMPEFDNHHTILLKQGHCPLGVCSDDFRKFIP